MSLSSGEKATVKAGCRLESSRAGTTIKRLVTLDFTSTRRRWLWSAFFFFCQEHLSNVLLAFMLHTGLSLVHLRKLCFQILGQELLTVAFRLSAH